MHINKNTYYIEMYYGYYYIKGIKYEYTILVLFLYYIILYLIFDLIIAVRRIFCQML